MHYESVDDVLHVQMFVGKGSLVKCYVERITHDYTAGDLRCPNCGAEFARESLVHGRPAHKIVGGKVYMK